MCLSNDFQRYTPSSSDKSVASASSSFYPGPTRYGGLMASPRSDTSSRSPYAVSDHSLLVVLSEENDQKAVVFIIIQIIELPIHL